MNVATKMRIFTIKYPLLGPIIWLLSVQYFVAQLFVVRSWSPAYSWADNFISDLGNTACGQYAARYVCSPDFQIMNLSFMTLGLTMALGSLLIYREFRETNASFLGFTLMGLAGLGTILVGVFPENTIGWAHSLGAILGLVVGNVSLIVLAIALKDVRRSFRIYTLLSGILSLIAFILFYFNLDIGLGRGTLERLVSYPQTLWLFLFGLYMTTSHVRGVMRRRRL